MRIFYRIFLLILIYISSYLNIQAQYVTIPDANFVNWLNNNGFSSCMNGNQMDTTCNKIVNTTFLDCSFSIIHDLAGIEYFDNLDTLFCQQNNLTSLPTMPSSLISLYCGLNQITSIPYIPTLIRLSCEQNNLTSLPTLPLSLIHLSCGSNQIVSLPTLPLFLKTFYCGYNPLVALPALPSSIQEILCDNDQLSALPVLPSSLFYFDCSNNQISSLPQLPPLLAYFDCSANQISSLPSLPLSLKNLMVDENLLTNLPLLPNSLTDLKCSYNQLSTLPFIPNKLSRLYCSNNQLNLLFQLPDTMIILDISNNPNLGCLPSIKQIKHVFIWDISGINCLPNVISCSFSYPSIDTIPICDLSNPNNCNVYWNIKGAIYADTNGNCLVDNNELLHTNIKVNLYKNSNFVQQTLTNALGQYSFETDTGAYYYTVDTNGTSLYLNCPTTGGYNSIITSVNDHYFDKDFSLNNSVGVTEYSMAQSLRIFPNPISNGLLNLFFQSSTPKATFHIYDLSGRAVYSTVVISSLQQQIELPALAPGIYQCVVHHNEGSAHRKLIVVR